MSVAAAAGDALKRRCSSSAAPTPSSCWPAPTSTTPCARGHRPRAEQRPVVHRRQALHRVDEVADEFESRFIESMDARVVGDPFVPETKMGRCGARPSTTSSRPGRGRAEAGAAFHTVPRMPEGPAACSRPTVPRRRLAERAIAKEEMFGPVAMVFRVRDARCRNRRRQRLELRARREHLGAPTRRRARNPGGERGRRGLRQRPGRLRSPRCPSAASSDRATGASSRRGGLREFGNAKTVYVGVDGYFDLSRPRRHHAAAARGGGGHGRGVRRRPRQSHRQPPRRSGPAACSRRPATRWPPSSAATPARSSSPRVAPSRPIWLFWGPPRRPARPGVRRCSSSAVEHPAVREAARAAAKAGLDPA